METGKERLGTEVWLAVHNPKFGRGKCPCCGSKISKKQPRYILAEGYFNKVECDGEHLLYYAEYEDESTGKYKEALINCRWLGDIVDGEFYEEQHQFSKFAYYLKDISIFDRQYADDEGDYAFKTKGEAIDWLDDFGEE